MWPGHDARKGHVQATGHLRASSAHQKIRECMLCPLVSFGAINDDDCDLQGPSSVAGWLAAWPPFQAALRPRSKRTQRVCVSLACALHCGYMEQNFSEQRACRREVTHRVDVSEWPNGGCGITTTSRFTVSIILVVITTLKERRVVAVMLL